MKKPVLIISVILFFLGITFYLLDRIFNTFIILDFLTPTPIYTYLIFTSVMAFFGYMMVNKSKTIKIVSSAFMFLFVAFFWTLTLLMIPEEIKTPNSDWVIYRHSFFFDGTYRIYKKDNLFVQEQFSCAFIEDKSFCSIDISDTHIEIRYGNYGEPEQIKYFYYEEN